MLRHLEPLESRRLLSVTLEDGLLRVDGTKGNDIVEIWEWERDRKVAVRFNSRRKFEWYHMRDIRQIVVETGRGNDSIEITWGDVDVFVYGGRGNDTIRASDGGDWIDGGLDDDLITGGRGDDTLIGGRGDDEISDTRGADALLGGAGIDTVRADATDDVIRDVENIHHTDRWEEIEPEPGMISRTKLLQNEASANLFIEFVFPDSGYTVTSAVAQRPDANNEIRVVVGVARWLGGAREAITHVQTRVPSGDLPAGTYTFVIASKGGQELARRSFERT